MRLEGRNESGVRLSGGSAFNAVPDSILYDGERRDELADKLDHLGFAFERRTNGIEVRGRAAHAMIPEEGINAIARLCIALDQIDIQSQAINFVAREIGQDPFARRIFGDISDEASGRLKFNVGRIDLGRTEQLSIDVRLPVTTDKEEIARKLTAAAARYELEYQEYDWLGPIHLPLDHFMVTTLMNVYRKNSGDLVTQPRASGGATYARAIPNCVAFGALSVDETLTEHQPNERTVLANLYQAVEIYAHAVFELTR